MADAISTELYLSKSKIHGKGVFAGINIKRHKKFYCVPLNQIYKHALPQRAYVQDIVWVDDPSILNWVNHSCNPNTSLKFENGSLYLISLQKINQGDEITCDYSETEIDGSSKVCSCTSIKCKGYYLCKK
ncbi:SET domain-containing protein [Candidatus Nomurabacteria bacterium]|nr:SET domain-containing protein [Candidatus Nomurabacteria bacterium]